MPVEALRQPLSPDAIREQAVALGPWFHNIDLGHGIMTRDIAPAPGPQRPDHPLNRWTIYKDVLPRDMTGMRVLDLGSVDGFFTLEMARRGAMVLAQVTGLHDRISTRIGKVTAIAPTERYDAVMALGLLYHLRHPFHDLEIIAKASDLLWLETTLHAGDESYIYFKPPTNTSHHIRKWFPTRACVRDMLEECKFTTIQDIPDPTPNRGSFLARR